MTRTAADVHRLYVDHIMARDWAAVRALLHPDYEYRSGDGEVRVGPDAGVELTQSYVAAFPDLSFDVAQRFSPSDTVSIFEMTARGTHGGPLGPMPATGRTVSVLICDIIETRDGLVHREREYFDQLAMMTQLGAIPEQPGALEERTSEAR